MFREKRIGPYWTKNEIIASIVRLLLRRGIVARKSWFTGLSSKHVLYGMWIALCEHGRMTQKMVALLGEHDCQLPEALVPSVGQQQKRTWRFIEQHDDRQRQLPCTGRSIGEAALECAKMLKMHPRSEQEAITMLQERCVLFPEQP